jgi:hypothetical protein
MKRIKARKAQALFGRNGTVIRLRGVTVDPQLVVAASLRANGQNFPFQAEVAGIFRVPATSQSFVR